MDIVNPGSNLQGMAVQTISRQIVDQARDSASRYFSELHEVNGHLGDHRGIRESAWRQEQEAKRAKKLRQEKILRGGNPFLKKPQGPVIVSYKSREFSPPARAAPTHWTPPPRNEDDNSPAALIRRALAQNLFRLTDLFKRWDVNLDNKFDIHELKAAVGALGIDRDGDWNKEAMETFLAGLDLDGNGTIELDELHEALRQYHPPKVEDLKAPKNTNIISVKMPTRQEGKVSKSEREDRAAAVQVKRLLAENQYRVMDVLHKWDYDKDSEISIHDLKRALGALSIPIDMRALQTLFNLVDADGSGAISFDELNLLFRRRVGNKAEQVIDDDHDAPAFAAVTQLTLPPITGPMRQLTGSVSAPVLLSRKLPKDAFAAAKYADANAGRMRTIENRQAMSRAHAELA